MASYDDTATISGSVVSFSNGADDVPTKSLVVTIPPTLSGVSVLTEKQTGRNLVNGYIDYSNVNKVIEPQFYKAGTYTFSCVRATNINGIYVRKGSVINLTAESISSKYNTLTSTFTVSEDGYYFIQLYRNTSSPTWEDEPVTNVQLEIGSTAHAYEPYAAPTVYTASLGRTIYGGSVDVVAGTGTEGYNKITLSSLLTDLNVTQIGTTGVYRIRFSIADAKGAINSSVFNGLCDYYTPITANQTYAQNEGISINTSGQCYIYDSRFNTSTSLNDFKTWIDANPVNLCYELATGTDFTFDGQEINTRLGYNAFWSEQGNTELTYYKDGYGFTSVTIHKETPNGEPVEQTAKFHRIVYGGKADVIRGTCEPKNLFDADNPNVISGYISTTAFSTENQNAKTVYVPIKAGTTYTVSKTAGQRFQIATSNVIPSDGALYTSRVSQSGSQSSLTITSGANDTYLWAWVFLDGTDTGTLAEMLSSVQIEEGSYASDYVPGFTPFTFTPISMETDEGENTLFANEGASAITYRKAVD